MAAAWNGRTSATFGVYVKPLPSSALKKFEFVARFIDSSTPGAANHIAIAFPEHAYSLVAPFKFRFSRRMFDRVLCRPSLIKSVLLQLSYKLYTKYPPS
eukprot:gene3930-biopygen3866